MIKYLCKGCGCVYGDVKASGKPEWGFCSECWALHLAEQRTYLPLLRAMRISRIAQARSR